MKLKDTNVNEKQINSLKKYNNQTHKLKFILSDILKSWENHVEYFYIPYVSTLCKMHYTEDFNDTPFAKIGI